MKKTRKESFYSPKRILLVKTHAIGDTILITPALHALRGRFPDARITLLTGRAPEEIMEGNADIDEILSFDESALFTPNPFEIMKLIKQMRAGKFDLVFIFHYSIFMHWLVSTFGIPIRIGFSKSALGIFLTHKVPWDDSGQRWVADLHLDMARLVNAKLIDKKLKIEISQNDLDFADNLLKANKVGCDDILVGIFPGGGKNPRDTVYQKHWGIEKYAAVIDALVAKYKAKIIIFGSLNDQRIISKLIEFSVSPVINTCGKLSLKQLSALIKKCSLLVTNDSAPLHIACATDIPIVALFGPSRAKAVMNPDDKHIAIQSQYPCSPCYSNSVFPGCDNPQCMEAIKSEVVLAAIEKQLNKFCFGVKIKPDDK